MCEALGVRVVGLWCFGWSATHHKMHVGATVDDTNPEIPIIRNIP